MSCRGHYRHWFRDYGVVGLPRPTCVRCDAPNPNITDEDRREYEAYWGDSFDDVPLPRPTDRVTPDPAFL